MSGGSKSILCISGALGFFFTTILIWYQVGLTGFHWVYVASGIFLTIAICIILEKLFLEIQEEEQ